ncbi:MAG: pyruvate kinase [Chloroflexota bacterium]|nr:pyruvate kinase [Chloroflexota bacterium]
MRHKILVTIGPCSLEGEIIRKMNRESIYLYRINMSHTRLEDLQGVITEIQKHTDVPICIDSEGAQVRNHKMGNGSAQLITGTTIKINYSEILGDFENISFTPDDIVKRLQVGDIINIDFDSVSLKVGEVNTSHVIAKVINGGFVGSNKAADVNRQMDLPAITSKDRKAITTGKEMGIKHFALSFANRKENVDEMRKLVGPDAKIISKIESRSALLNLEGIIEASDEILIDRGDLSREVDLILIPFLQRRIVSIARSKGTPVYVATNLLESMIRNINPTRAEVNDVVSTLLHGANGLVLAAETAVGKYPVDSVRYIRLLMNQLERWTSNTSINELLNS